MTRPSPRKVAGKVLPPLYIGIVDGVPDGALWSYGPMTAKRWRYAGWKCDRVVRYVPSLPRKAGARRGK